MARRTMGRALALTSALLVAACHGGESGGATNDYSETPPPVLPTASGVAGVPQGPYAGIAVSAIEKDARNPYTGNPQAIAGGQALFLAMNCSGCHGQDAKAGIFAPNLTDGYWRYGGSDADVFNSIYDGRARGMPAWGAMLSSDQIWQLVAYIRSLGGMTGPRLPSTGPAPTDTLGSSGPETMNKRQP